MNPHTTVLTVEIKLVEPELANCLTHKPMTVYRHQSTEQLYLATGWQEIEQAIVEVINHGLIKSSDSYARRCLCFPVEILKGDRYQAFLRSLEELPRPRFRQRVAQVNSYKPTRD